LDIKPYLPSNDSVESAITPEWIHSSINVFKKVEWIPEIEFKLKTLVEKSAFYKSASSLQEFISDVLKFDIRSLHRKEVAESDASFQLHVDSFMVLYRIDAHLSIVTVLDVVFIDDIKALKEKH
jgi:hypothetical protein